MAGGEGMKRRAGVINIIVGGSAGGGDSRNSRKGYARSLHVNSIGVSSRFGDIADFDVKRVLVDTGSAANVMSWEAFKGLKIPTDRLKSVNTPLQGFGGGTVIPEGIVDLPVVLGQHLYSRFEPTDEVEIVELGEGKKVTIGRSLSDVERINLVSMLRENVEVFAWETDDLPGVDPSIAQHRLNNKASFKPVKQRKRQFAPERQQAIKEELEKLLKAGFYQRGRACPKDCFPLPRIDALVDATAGKKRFSFLDAFSGYHQISLAPEDAEKTSFITDFGTFCYTAMPFGLKNAGATYQRMVNKVFGNLISRKIEAYVDDMVVYSNEEDDHVEDLRENFQSGETEPFEVQPREMHIRHHRW
ncbi:Reverse transcriptase domain-containing protein [Abeliophyllum distichum]|uniref:Reverse transcriptase domain-containing protein n=1 Tax=Abeliophyllum distichum TaxID=126358 RepID=A0ABD1QHH7_9LAMI